MVVHSVEEGKNIFEYTPDITPVPVIANFSNDGKVCPLYFAAEGIRIKIDNIKWQKGNNIYLEFHCEITLSDRVEEIRLVYYFRNHVWGLKKV